MPERVAATIAELVATGTAVIDSSGRVIASDASLRRLLGATVDDLFEHPIATLAHPDDRDALLDLIARPTATSNGVLRLVRRDGSVLDARISALSIPAPEDGHGSVVITVADLDAPREAVERLQASESLLRLATTVARVGGWSIDLTTDEVSWSEELHALLDNEPGAPAPELDEALSLYPEPWLTEVRAALAECAATGTPFDLEVPVRTLRGGELWVRSVGEAERDETGAIVRLHGAFQDITERKHLGERVINILESTTDAFYMLDHEWRFVYVNALASVLIQRSPSSVLGKVVWEEFPAAAGTHLQEAYERAMRDDVSVTIREYYYPEPLDKWFDIHVHPSSQGLSVYFRDVTAAMDERRRYAEQERILARHAALLDQAQDAIVVFGADRTVTFWNGGAERLYGRSAAESIGRPLHELIGISADELDELVARVHAEGAWSGEMAQTTHDGTRLVVQCGWSSVHDDVAGTAVLAIHTDVTEPRRIEAQLLRTQRMESIGTLAGGIAHDVNNVLTPILLSIALLREETDASSRAGLLDVIESSAARGADLVRQVLAFARGAEGRRVEVQIPDLVRAVVTMALETFPRDIRIQLHLDPACHPVVGEPTQLHQVLMNLCLNARDALPDGGTITISADHETDPTGDPWVRISVGDDGVGMAPAVAAKVFEPFFTTKDLGRGTGLGLPTAHTIVTGHGGTIEVRSEPGRGSTFVVRLPALAAPSTAPPSVPVRPAIPEPSLPRGDGELVLVVDDEPAVRDVTTQALEAFGYRVVTASNGTEALEVVAAHGDEIAAVLTDMMMPVMDGATFVTALRARHPNVPVIATSGLISRDDAQPLLGVAADRVLGKPYTTATLVSVVADVLGR